MERSQREVEENALKEERWNSVIFQKKNWVKCLEQQNSYPDHDTTDKLISRTLFDLILFYDMFHYDIIKALEHSKNEFVLTPKNWNEFPEKNRKIFPEKGARGGGGVKGRLKIIKNFIHFWNHRHP